MKTAGIRNLSLLFSVFVLAFSCGGDKSSYGEYGPAENTIRVRGSVGKVRDVRVVVHGDDIRFDDSFLIKVKKGSFDAYLPLDTAQVYELLVPHAPGYAAFTYAYFFAEPGGVEFVMDGDVPRLSDPVGKNRIYVDYESLDSEFRAGEMKTLCKRQDELFSADNYFSKEYRDLVEKSGSKHRSKEQRDSLWHEAILLSQSGEDLTPEARELKDAFAEERALHAKFALDYLENTEASLPAFCILVDNLEKTTGAKDLIGDFIRIYEGSYASLFQGSNLHKSFSDAISSAGMYEGAHYVDFTLPDEEGTERSLSSIIDGKPAVLDLWASWCHSCRVSSKAMIPVYTKYHASGLEYVGVAREYKDEGKWRQALSDDAYPWPNLIALEKDHSIWSKYGIPSAAGSLFLIDAGGTVVKINPAPSEVEEFMRKYSLK